MSENPKLDVDPIDLVLARLCQPTNVHQRLEILQEIVKYWHVPVLANDGIPEEALTGIRAPMPLKWWYAWAGRREDIMTGQNSLLSPTQLEIKNAKLVFYGENQWVYEWATELHGDDPPVFGRYRSEGPWNAEGILLSEHLILACLFESLMGAPFGAYASWIGQGKLNQFSNTMAPICISPWKWLGPTRFYAGKGAFMHSMPNGEIDGKLGYSIWIGAKTLSPLSFLRGEIDDTWEYVSLDAQ